MIENENDDEKVVPNRNEQVRFYEDVAPEDMRVYNRRVLPIKNNKGTLRTMSMFDVGSYPISEQTIFTMKREDVIVNGFYLFSFRRLFLEGLDPTSYKTSDFLFGDPRHIMVLAKTKSLSDFIADCFEELEVKLQAEAINTIRLIAGMPDIKALPAAKYIAELGYKKQKPENQRGRPSAAEKQAKLIQDTADARKLAEDAKRLGFKDD